MQSNRKLSQNLFISVVISFLLLFLAALPVLASNANNPFPSYSGTPTQNSAIFQSGTISSSQPSQTALPSQVLITETQTTTLTLTSTPTFTPSPTSNSNAEPTPLQTQFSFLPYAIKQPTYTPTPNPIPETVLFCDTQSQPLSIPDNNPSGINNDIRINDGRILVNMKLYINITHTWVGDLVVKLTNLNTGVTITALDRPGDPPLGCGNDNIVSVLADYAAQSANDKCANYPSAISGVYRPIQKLSTFSGNHISGTWRINVSDQYQNDLGTLNHWCLETDIAEGMPVPTPTPTYVNLPASASVSGMSGQDQQLNLDCESRSAVDWAKHFGFNLGEIDFLNHLSRSDDPEIGFVGNPDGGWGNIPPNDYGVHSPPVGSLLRYYGLTANSFHSLQWDDLRAEIASGNPAIVWIIGGANYNLVNGTPHLYTAASSGDTTIVAPWEHTVILVGYTSSTVTILNGSKFITISLNQFLDSWSALDFMAVLARLKN
jgi:subtilisin-like proprotein convertase family protein/uncharacterized protein YvpB